MTRQNERGMASFVIVSVLVVILTLISLGFARIMTRSAIDSTNRQLGNAATYAAQSGINDVISYMKQYATDHPSNPYVSSPQCNGSNSLIGSAGNPGPFYNDSNLSGNRNAQYSCILLNQTPSDLVYSGLPPVQSQVVKMTTSAVTGALDKIMLSWQPTNALLTGYPNSNLTLLDENTWTDPINGYMPIFRVTIYPVPVSGNVSNLQANARTVFLYPQAPSPPNNVPVQNYVNIADGQKLPVNCGGTNTNGAFNGKADYRCNLIINNLTNSVSSPGSDPINYVYLRLTPIYGQLDVKIQANDIWGQSLKFINVQAIVDVTAKVANVSKRLQARVNTTNVSSSIGGNIPSAANDIPEFSLRSSDALCKRLIVQHGPYYDNILPGAPDNICHTGIAVPAPSLALSIIGKDGADNGKRVCGTPWYNFEQTTWGCATDNNPDSPQDPVQKGTVYINSSATIEWRTRDAKSCIASWDGGQKLTSSTWSDTVQADGREGKSGISTVQHYTLSCTGPGSAGGEAIVKTVTAWPPPRITSLSQNPNPVQAGTQYTISWDSINTKDAKGGSYNPCYLSSSTNSWISPGWASHSGSQTMTWPANDNSSTRYFTVTCYDPIGRSDSSTIWVNTNGGGCSGNGCNGGGGDVSPPTCSASASIVGNTTSDAYVTWSTSCPTYDPVNPIGDRFIESDIPGAMYGGGYASPSWMGSGTVRITSPSTYHFRVYVWAPPWASQSEAAAYGSTSGAGKANSGLQIKTIYPPLSITSYYSAGVWDQGPECGPKAKYPWGASANNTWWCRNGYPLDKNGFSTRVTTYPGPNPGCVKGVHRWTTCNVHWSTSGGGGTVDCRAYVIGYSGYYATSSWPWNGDTKKDTGRLGWLGGGAITGWARLDCSDSFGQTAHASF